MVPSSITEVRKAFTFTVDGHIVLQSAEICAGRYASGEVRTEHLLLSIVDNRDIVVGALLTEYGVTRRAIEHELMLEEQRYNERVRAGQQAIAVPRVGIDPSLARALDRATQEVKDDRRLPQREPIGLEHLLVGLSLEPSGFASSFLLNRGLDYVRLRQRLYQQAKPFPCFIPQLT